MDYPDNDGLVYYQDVYKKPVKAWPLPRVLRPNINELVDYYVPQPCEPAPLDPKFITDFEINQNQLQVVSEDLAKIEAEYKSFCDELEALEKESRWNNKANREVRVANLNKQINTIKLKKEKASDVYNKILKDGEYNNYMIMSHRSSVESYENIMKMKALAKIEGESGTEEKSPR